MTSALKTFFRFLLLSPVLLLGYCVVTEHLTVEGLKEICDAAEPGGNVKYILRLASEEGYRMRTGGLEGLDEDEWFDREYARISRRKPTSDEIPLQISVVFAKPGLGYYACILLHEGDAILTSEFEDNSS